MRGKFDTEAGLTMMAKKLLEPIGYDYSQIIIQYMAKVPLMSETQLITPDEEVSEVEVMEQEGQIMQGM